MAIGGVTARMVLGKVGGVGGFHPEGTTKGCKNYESHGEDN